MMKKGYYIAQIPESEVRNKTVGVSKKICDQIAYFNSLPDTTCEYVSFSQKLGTVGRFLSFFKTTQYDLFFENLKDADFLYIRAIVPNNKSLITFLKRIKQNKPTCKILYEIPTYPYDNEMKSLREKVFLFVDKLYRKKLKDVVNYIVTLTDDKEIWGAPTLHISNGIDVSRIPLSQKKETKQDEITLIAVAQFSFWHGYDRLIEGLHNYYTSENPPQTEVKLHMVGNDNGGTKY